MAVASKYPPHVYSSQSTGTTLNSYTGSYMINPNGNNVITGSYSAAAGNYTTSVSSNLTGQGLNISGDANIDGNIKWRGHDLGKLLETMEKRLAILEPNPRKLAKWEALQKAYKHYKLLEALLHEDDEDGC